VSPSSDPLPGLIPDLTDGVVRLRELGPGDVEAMLQHASEPGMRRWTSIPQPYTRRHAEEDLALATEGWLQATGYCFAIESAGRFAGLLDLHLEGAGLADVGFSLNAWARGHGLMARALRLGITWAFAEARIEVVRWRAQVGNWPSRRVAWATGFRVDAPIPGLLHHRGRQVDGWIAALRRGDPLQPAHAWLVPERITGRPVMLREYLEPDVPRLIEMLQDQETQRWLSALPLKYTVENARDHLERILAEQAAGRSVHWVIADPADNRLLGEVMIFVRDARERHGEVGYCAHPDARGRGTTTEGVRLAVRHALLPILDGGLGLNRVLLRAAEGNLGSQRIAQKAGFTRTGVDRGADRLRDGTLADDIRFDLLPGELPTVELPVVGWAGQ
jgi:RimJ/RimL family protein N-acetyltransferase